jgi:hypothetical protein
VLVLALIHQRVTPIERYGPQGHAYRYFLSAGHIDGEPSHESHARVARNENKVVVRFLVAQW